MAGEQFGIGVLEIVLAEMFAAEVELVVVRAKTLKLYAVPLVRPVIDAVVWPETRKEFE